MQPPPRRPFLDSLPKQLCTLALVLLLGFIAFYALAYGDTQRPVSQLSYSAFTDLVNEGKVLKATIDGRHINAALKSGGVVTTTAPDDPMLVGMLRAGGVDMQVADPVDIPVLALVSALAMVTMAGVVVYQLFRNRNGALGRQDGFAKGRAAPVPRHVSGIRFKDVAGIDEVREQLEEIVAYLRQPHRFRRLGAKTPKGVLLSGPPGCGKTLLAKAIAGEADVPFFAASGSEFVEMYVGVGAGRVRDLFEKAKKAGRAIIFIDEIDAVGRSRSAGGFSGNEERETTLNQILVEMDGFDGAQDVIVIAATNRPDVLDSALTRPGRFDRKIVVPLPDINGRERILRTHAARLVTDRSVDLRRIAQVTPGFSGADLANVANEAALAAARADRASVTIEDFHHAIDVQMMGAARPSLAMNPAERQLTAYHEAGHALTAALLPDSDPIHKATITPRGGALGMVVRMPENDRVSVSRRKLEADLVVAMAGRAAESLVFGEERVTAGASGDIDQATRIARKMVTEWGMDREVGMVRLTESDPRTGEPVPLGETTRRRIDERVRTLIDKAYGEAYGMLQDHSKRLHMLALALLERETLSGEEIATIVGPAA